jgi:hypothetical protein
MIGFIDHCFLHGHCLCLRTASMCAADQSNGDCKRSGSSRHGPHFRDLCHQFLSFACAIQPRAQEVK